MTKVIIAEKPSVAKKIAQFISDTKPKYVKVSKGKDTAYYYIIENNGEKIFVAAAAGHLYEVDTNIQGYDYPIFETEWKPKYRITDAKGSPLKIYSYTEVYEMAIKQAVCAAAGKKCNKPPSANEMRSIIVQNNIEIYVATDFDREGETIAYTILKYSLGLTDDDIREHVKRMKFSAITKGEILKAFKNPISFQFSLAEAGIARHELDWIWGINVSRALTNSTKSAGKFMVLSTGRVQGPTLKIIVDREKEIENFVSKPFWYIKAIGEKDGIKFEARHTTSKFWDKSEAEKVYSKIRGHPLVVKSINFKTVKKNPPAPFDLTTLQKEAYRIYKYSPKKTLSIAQKLYEKSYLTYPRTDSQKLPNKDWQSIIEKLKAWSPTSFVIEKILNSGKFTPVQGKKDDPAHKAIHPTGIVPEDLDPDEKNIYELVLRRFLAAFMEPAEFKIITINFEANGEKFVASAKSTIKQGYLEAYPYDTPEDIAVIPEFKEGEKIEKVAYRLIEDKTKPPSRYSLSTLITTMEKLGLGTKATRGDIIDTLFKRGYIVGKQSIRPTDLGRVVIETLESEVPEIVSVEMTANLENKLSQIIKREASKDELLNNTINNLSDILEKFKERQKEIGSNIVKNIGTQNNIQSGASHGKKYTRSGQKRRSYKSGKRTNRSYRK